MNAPRAYQRETLQFSSIAPDLIAQDAPADVWNTSQNVLFKNGETLRAFGDTPTLTGAATGARCAVFLGVSAQGYWVYATNAGIFAHDGTTEFDITPVGGWTGTTDATFTATVLNGIAYINASDRDPVYWAGASGTPCQPLPDWPAGGRCLALRAHKNFLFAVGFISEGAQRVRWSDAAEAGTVPQFWTPAPDNLASFIDIAPLSSPCLEGKTLRDSLLIYKNESVWSLDFVGGTSVFSARKLFSEHGIVNTNAITGGIDDVHLFVGDEGDIFLTDGVRVQSVLDGRLQRTFYSSFAQNKAGLFAAATLAREKVAFVAYPLTGSTVANQAIVYDFISGDVGLRQMPDILCAAEGAALGAVGDENTWDGDSEAWDPDSSPWLFEVVGQTLDDVLVAGDFGFALVSDPGASEFISGPIVAQASKGGLALGNPQSRKMINRLWPKVTGTNGATLQFRFGSQEATSGPVTLMAPIDYVIGSNVPIDLFMQGRFLSVEVSSVGGPAWRLGSMDIEFRELGAW